MSSGQESQEQLLATFASTVESSLKIFAKMTRPAEKAEAVILWNVISEKLQAIVNESTDALKQVSLIVIRNCPENNVENLIPVASHSGSIDDKVDQSDQNCPDPPPMSISKEMDFRLRKIYQHPHPKSKKVVKEKGIESRLRKILEQGQQESLKFQKCQDKSRGIPLTESSDSQTTENPNKGQSPEDDNNSPSNLSAMESRALLLQSTGVDVDDEMESTRDDQDASSDSSSSQEDNDLSVKSPDNNDLSCQSSKDFPTRLNKVKVVEKNRWSCTSCEKQFDDYLALQNHISCEHHSSSVVKPFQCTTCHISFSTKSNYNVHLRRHSGERPFPCPKCSIRFTTSNNLRRHLLSHQGVKPYRCSICDSRFAEKRSLQGHIRNHTGERPFSCTECSRSFKQKKVLQTHMLTHSSAKPFLCQQCGQAFKQKAHLRSHETRHQGDKIHACHYCKSAFVNKSDLNRHEQSHRGEKPFVCKEENCGKSFMRNQTLKEHLNRCH